MYFIDTMHFVIGVVDGNAEAVDAYLAHGGNIARCLTLDEINSLNRPSAFDVGHTLVHLAIRFQRHNILALLLTPEVRLSYQTQLGTVFVVKKRARLYDMLYYSPIRKIIACNVS